MEGMNQVIVEGKLVKNPEYKVFKDDKAFCKFTIAVNKSYKDRKKDVWIEEVSYFLVETWRGLAEICNKYLEKGRAVRVIGELKQYRWSDPENGNKKRDMIYIIADYVDFQPIRRTNEGESSTQAEIHEELDSKETVELLNKEASESLKEMAESEQVG